MDVFMDFCSLTFASVLLGDLVVHDPIHFPFTQLL